MRFNFSSPLGMSSVMGKYIGLRYKEKEGKTHPHLPHCHAYMRLLVIIVKKFPLLFYFSL